MHRRSNFGSVERLSKFRKEKTGTYNLAKYRMGLPSLTLLETCTPLLNAGDSSLSFSLSSFHSWRKEEEEPLALELGGIFLGGRSCNIENFILKCA